MHADRREIIPQCITEVMSMYIYMYMYNVNLSDDNDCLFTCTGSKNLLPKP